ncbi:MAG: 30S ribosomal protein S13 [Candidatus Helarchaeota archaeon]
MSKSSYRHIIRMFGTDIDGNRKVFHALCGIRGVGQRFAKVVIKKAELDPDIRLGFLSDADIKKLEEIIKNPLNFDIPAWMLNRQSDIVKGKDDHVIGANLQLVWKSDIDRMKRTRSYRGIRHHLGLKVRGQRTRTTGRRGAVVGVHRKNIKGAKK